MAKEKKPSKVNTRSMVGECLNCSAIWSVGTEEYEVQCCSACGWRPGDVIAGMEDEDIDLDKDFEFEEEDEQ